MLLCYLGKHKIWNFTLFMYVKHVPSVTYFHVSNIYLSNVMKISAKINTMQNINILLFVRSLYTCLSKLGLSTTKHQHSKKSDTMDTSYLNQKLMTVQIVCKSLFIKDVQNVYNLHAHMPGDAFFSGQLQCRECPVRNQTIPQLSIPSVYQQCSLWSGRHAAPSLPTLCSQLDLGRDC